VIRKRCPRLPFLTLSVLHRERTGFDERRECPKDINRSRFLLTAYAAIGTAQGAHEKQFDGAVQRVRNMLARLEPFC
jgi:hypothetical protein